LIRVQGFPDHRRCKVAQTHVGEDALEKGARVRFTANRLGLVAHLDATRFEEETVEQGDEGTYLGPHPNPRLDGWHVISVQKGERELFAPVHENQFEAVTT
jgi:hypothetical protein